MDDKQVAAVIISIMRKKVQETLKEVKIKRKRRVWTKPWLKNRDQQKCIYSNIFQELRLRDQEEFRKYLRMNTDTYTVIFNIFYE